MAIKRETAYKIKIKDILENEYIINEGMEANFIKINDKNVSRASIIGTITSKNENSLNIDDGTAEIVLRNFNNLDLNNIEVGNIVQIIGRPRAFEGQNYVFLEVISQIDKEWFNLRKMELDAIKQLEKPKNTDSNTIINI